MKNTYWAIAFSAKEYFGSTTCITRINDIKSGYKIMKINTFKIQRFIAGITAMLCCLGIISNIMGNRPDADKIFNIIFTLIPTIILIITFIINSRVCQLLQVIIFPKNNYNR